MELNQLPAILGKLIPTCRFSIDHYALCSELKANVESEIFLHGEEDICLYIFSSTEFKDCANPYEELVKKDPEKYAVPFVKFQEYQLRIRKEVFRLLNT